MNECLITKLKANVQDDSLAKLGVLRVELKPDSTSSYPLMSNEGKSVLTVVSGTLTGTFKTSGEAVVFPYTLPQDGSGGYVTLTTGNEGAVIELSDKYSLSEIRPICRMAKRPQIDITELLYCNKLTSLEGINGDMSKIQDNFPNLTRVDLALTNSYGKLSDFGKCTKLSFLITRNSSVSGSIEDFVKAQRANGRTSCDSLNMGYENAKLTFNGVSIGSETDDKILSWTESTITYDGETIEA